MRMAKVLGRSLFFAVLLAFAWPAHASPLLSLILSIAQEVASQPEAKPAPPVTDLPQTYPGTTVEALTCGSRSALSQASRSSRRRLSIHTEPLPPAPALMANSM